jgi:hypothetical protein
MIDAGLSPASFRDPSGFVFEKEGDIYRQINQGFQDDLQMLVQSGLQAELEASGLVVKFEEVNLTFAASTAAAIVIRQERIRVISYPFEW